MQAIVTFYDGRGRFSVCLPKAGEPQELARVLSVIAPRFRAPFVAGEATADFLGVVEPKVRACLTHRPEQVYGAGLWYTVYHTSGAMRVRVSSFQDGNPGSVPLFDGYLSSFVTWSREYQEQSDYDRFIRRIVQFKYEGGQNKGGLRTVRVEKVTRKGSKLFLEGYDLGKPDLLTDAYRQYEKTKISGDIKVLV